MRSQRGFGFVQLIGLVLLIGLGVIGYKQYDKWSTQRRLEHAQAIVEQDRKRIGVVSAKWDDARRLAGSTSRIALVQPVERLQAIKREFEEVRVSSPCMKNARDLEAEAMGQVIEGLMAFMRQEKYDSEEALTEATKLMRKATSAYLACEPK